MRAAKPAVKTEKNETSVPQCLKKNSPLLRIFFDTIKVLLEILYYHVSKQVYTKHTLNLGFWLKWRVACCEQ
jgi:hypothetical protein